MLFAGAIASVAVAHYGFDLNAVLAFWIAYILTRPLGASTGDCSRNPPDGGLGLGTTVTSFVFLGAIVVVVVVPQHHEARRHRGARYPPRHA